MTTEVVLETERLRLTNWLPEQIEDVVRLHSDPRVTRFLNAAGQPETVADAERRMAEWAQQFAASRMGKLRVSCRDDGAFLGRAGFGVFPPTGEPEIGYALVRSAWGKGYATEAAAGLRDWFFAETDRDHFIGFADARNAASIAVLRRIGMTPTHAEDFEGMACRFHIFRREDLDG